MPYGQVLADVIGTSVAGSNLGAKNASTLQNRLINAGFAINQRGYVSGTALSAGTYAHDRFKAGASGCTYTFTQLATGVPIVITITAGSLQQVIEGANIPDGGTFTLSWTGTAQGRFNGGTYGSSPLAVTGLTAGSNCTIEFNTGTCSFPQLEVGTSATGFEYRMYQQELALCQRYFWKQTYQQANTRFGTGIGLGDATIDGLLINLPVPMRTVPTNAVNAIGVYDGTTAKNITALSTSYSSPVLFAQQATADATTTAGKVVQIYATGSTAFVSSSAEL